MSETSERFDCWAIVEAMGFKKYAGHVTTQELAGSSFIRVDVPQTSIPAYSKLIGAGSIYMITPTDEATARKAAAVLARGDSPLPVYIPEQRQLPERSTSSSTEINYGEGKELLWGALERAEAGQRGRDLLQDDDSDFGFGPEDDSAPETVAAKPAENPNP
jgi:hypothetical protein